MNVPYRRIRSLGTGSYGEVSLVEKNDTIYAMKRLSMLNLVSTITETSLLASMNHAYIMKPVDYFQDGTVVNIVMKQVAKSLHDVIRYKHNMDVRLLLHQLLSAVDYMHQNGIIHRDLKPGNIMIDNSDYPLIIDLGLAHYSTIGEVSMSTNVQTLGYKAPEILAGDSYDEKIDIFSMGIIACRLIGVRPFDIYATRIEQMDVRIALSRIRDTKLKNLISLMLEVDPTRRASAEELLNNSYFDDLSYHSPDAILWNEDEGSTATDIMSNSHVVSFISKFNMPRDVVHYTGYMIERSTLKNMPVTAVIILMCVVAYIYDQEYGRIVVELESMLRTDRRITNQVYDILDSLDMTIF